MKVCLINPPDLTVEDPLWDEPLGLLYLGSILEKNGVTVKVVDLNFHMPNWQTELHGHDADIYGVYCSSSLLGSALEVNQILSNAAPKSLRTVGGPHATCMPHEMEAYFDAVVVGEGEKSILRLLDDFKDGIPKRVYESAPTKDLDTIPFPARHLLPIHRYHRRVGGFPSTGLVTARGCPNRCAFCSQKVWGNKVRFRSAENVVAEVKECLEKYNIRAFSIRDDTFTLNKTRLFKILLGFQHLDVVWRCLTRVDQVDQNTLRVMKDSGCVEIVYGIESGSQKILNNLQKGTTVEQNARAIDLTKDLGISCKAAVIIGNPGETWETVNETIRFIEKHTPDEGIVCIFTPYPGSPAWESPEKFGIKILTRDVTKYQAVGPNMKGKVVIETEEMTAKDIEEAHGRVLKRFKELGIVE